MQLASLGLTVAGMVALAGWGRGGAAGPWSGRSAPWGGAWRSAWGGPGQSGSTGAFRNDWSWSRPLAPDRHGRSRGLPSPHRPGRRGGRGRDQADRSARWATAGDLSPLVCPVATPGRLVLGTLEGGGRRRRGPVLATERNHSVAVIGPTQSGKTTAVAIPAILGWDGPVLATSVKTDLLHDTIGWRRQAGSVWCFDPCGVTGEVPSPWSPLATCETWWGARRTAADLTEVARTEGTTADGEFWYATAAKLLAPLLFAAAVGERSMSDVLRWVDTQEVGEVLDLLEEAGVPEAVRAAQASWQRDERQRSAVYTTAETVLEPFAGLAVGNGGPVGPTIDPTALLAGPNTLYACAPAHDQRRSRAVFTSLVRRMIDEAFSRSARSGRPLDPPLLVVLDEAANVAPLADLDGLAATGAGHGIQLVTVWQDLAQIAARYGSRAATVMNNHRAKLFLPGIADLGTLDQASHLVGDEELLAGSVTRDPSGARSTTASLSQRALLPPDALRRLPPGTGVLLYGSLPPARLSLRPWWEDPVLRERGGRD